MQANQVVDSANQPVATGTIGTFTVNIPPVTIFMNGFAAGIFGFERRSRDIATAF